MGLSRSRAGRKCWSCLGRSIPVCLQVQARTDLGAGTVATRQDNMASFKIGTGEPLAPTAKIIPWSPGVLDAGQGAPSSSPTCFPHCPPLPVPHHPLLGPGRRLSRVPPPLLAGPSRCFLLLGEKTSSLNLPAPPSPPPGSRRAGQGAAQKDAPPTLPSTAVLGPIRVQGRAVPPPPGGLQPQLGPFPPGTGSLEP